jgi:aminoglycoside phosphotransferase (APT) family kinase protein
MEPGTTTADMSGDLPEAITSWLEATLVGKIAHKERFVSRREGWLVDIECADGKELKGFLRLERFANHKIKRPICQVNRETAVISSLHARGISVPAVYAHSERLQATLFERVPGRDNIHELQDAQQQSDIAQDFMRQLAQLHCFDVSELGLAELPMPVSDEEYALSGINELERMYTSSAAVPDPLALLTFKWLRRNIPAAPARPALVQGDTGPGNFVYVNHNVSAILDWECAHIGDPMEDLGHLFSRAFFYPWGEMPDLLEVYSSATSQLLDTKKLHFYRVASFAKAALGSTTAVNHFNVEGPLSMMIFYSIAGERGLAQAIAQALSIDVEKAALPEPEGGLPQSLTLPIEKITEQIVDNELHTQLETPYLQQRAIDIRQLARYQARREQYLSAVLAQELRELEEVLQEPVSTVQNGLARINALIEVWDEVHIDDIVRYLNRRAQRAEALALPLAGQFLKLDLAPI